MKFEQVVPILLFTKAIALRCGIKSDPQHKNFCMLCASRFTKVPGQLHYCNWICKAASKLINHCSECGARYRDCVCTKECCHCKQNLKVSQCSCTISQQLGLVSLKLQDAKAFMNRLQESIGQ